MSENPFEAKKQFDQITGETKTDDTIKNKIKERLEELRIKSEKTNLTIADPFDVVEYNLNDGELPKIKE